MWTESRPPLFRVTLKYTKSPSGGVMEFINWMIAGALGVIVASTNPAVTQAQDNGNGHGKGHTKHDRDDDDEHSDHYYQHHDEEAVRAWYSENERHLPPGLAKKDQLPPGLEKQVVR